MTFAVIQDEKNGVKFYGPAREFWANKELEVMLSGPYETGKTFAALSKLHALMCKYPNSRGLMTRDTYADLINTAVVTYEKKVLPVPPEDANSGVSKFGGEKPQFYDYPNGARLIVAGLDNPGKTLSAEYDFIYVNQAEKISLNTWETLTRAVTGRAGNAPYTQIMGDCNPDVPTHWIKNRSRLKIFEQLHRYNPTLYDQETGELTPRGIKTMEVLNGLTGLRKKRGLENKWVSAEGQVYADFDPDIHVIKPFDIPKEWTRYRAIDFGYMNPFVCQWWAVDHDGRLYLYREIYMTKRTVKIHAEQIKGLTGSEKITATFSDHDAEDRATLAENGIQTHAATKDISRGMQAVEERLKVQGDDKPRLFIFKDALVESDHELYREYPGDTQPVNTEQEFASYVWPDGKDGKPNKEVPVDMYNHGMDSLRYMVMAIDHSRGTLRIADAPKALSDLWGGLAG